MADKELKEEEADIKKEVIKIDETENPDTEGEEVSSMAEPPIIKGKF